MRLRQWIQRHQWLILAMGLSLPLAGCNMANSADKESSGSDEPSASLTIKSVNPVPNTDGSVEENAEMTIVASGSGSKNSGVQSCDISLFKFDSTDVFGTSPIYSIGGCGEKIMVAPATGRYKLVLTVTDNNSKTAKTERQLGVSKSILNSEFTVTQEANEMQINLDATSSTKGAGGEIVSYTWQVRLKIDDSTTAATTTQTNSSPTTKVVVNSDGIYVVQLTVTDAAGKTDVEQQQVSVASSSALVPEFTFTNQAGFTAPGNMEIQISPTETTDLNHLICYLWAYADGELGEAPIYQVYAENSTTQHSCVLPIGTAGLYAVDVKAVNNDGNEHIRRRIFNIS